MKILWLFAFSSSTTKKTYWNNILLFILLRILIVPTTLTPIRAAKVVQNNGERITGQRFAMEPQDQTAIVGSRVTLPCRVIDKEGTLQVSDT